MIEVHIDGVQNAGALRFYPIITHRDLGTHLRQSFGNRTSPRMLVLPTPSTRIGPPAIAPAAKIRKPKRRRPQHKSHRAKHNAALL